MFPLLGFLAQAALPPPNAHYFGRIDYKGPGLVCGAAFSVNLSDGESAVLIKHSAIDAELDFDTSEGKFSVHESQYATAGGEVVGEVGLGVLRVKRVDGDYVWIYRDRAPGSTDVFGAAVNSNKPTAALIRISFGGPRNGLVDGVRCLAGRDLDPK